MAEYATKDEVQDIVNKAVDDLSEIIGNLAQTMHTELTIVKEDNHTIRCLLHSEIVRWNDVIRNVSLQLNPLQVN